MPTGIDASTILAVVGIGILKTPLIKTIMNIHWAHASFITWWSFLSMDKKLCTTPNAHIETKTISDPRSTALISVIILFFSIELLRCISFRGNRKKKNKKKRQRTGGGRVYNEEKKDKHKKIRARACSFFDFFFFSFFHKKTQHI